jgi:hypothetical protein
MSTFAHSKQNILDLYTSKKWKLSVQQNFQRILAQEAATATVSTNENRGNNKFPPNEPMVKSRDANEHMSKPIANSNEGMADNLVSNGKASSMPSCDDSMSSEDDYNQNNFTFDVLFGLETMDDGITDNGQSVIETTPPNSRNGRPNNIIDGTP